MQQAPRTQNAPVAHELHRATHHAWPPSHPPSDPPIPSAAQLWRRERRIEHWGRIVPAVR